jgi:hypothetical protein
MPNFIYKNHQFTQKIYDTLEGHFGEDAKSVFENSALLVYLNHKTKSANKGSKSRGSFANHYALYVIVEDYINKGYFDNPSKPYLSEYEGAIFSDLFIRQRQLPFGQKLQNHALNSRLNDEFKKYFPDLGKTPIVRDTTNQKYWIQEDLLKVEIQSTTGVKVFNIAKAILDVIDEYVLTKKEAFQDFLDTCLRVVELHATDKNSAISFIEEQLSPNVDARIFEIVSYAILKEKYLNESIWIGFEKDDVNEESLALFKTGRTNANDGGIDFVMKPLGRFFQVTETIDANKYFLDIDKVQKFPMTFVVKTNESAALIKEAIKIQAKNKYGVDLIVNKYMDCIEEIINVTDLLDIFKDLQKNGQIDSVIQEVIKQSKVEFNYNVDELKELSEATEQEIEIEMTLDDEDEDDS